MQVNVAVEKIDNGFIVTSTSFSNEEGTFSPGSYSEKKTFAATTTDVAQAVAGAFANFDA